MYFRQSLHQRSRDNYWKEVNKQEELWEKYLSKKIDLQSYMAMVMCRPSVVKLSTAYELTMPKYDK